MRATGPKTSVDHCVDRCDEIAKWCEHPMYQTGCSIEYDSCIVRCDPPANANRTNERSKL